MLNKKAIAPLIIWIAIGVLAIGGGAAYLATNNNSNDPYVESVNTTTTAEGETSTEVVVRNTNTPNENLPLKEWCIKGQTYAISQEGATSNTVIQGIASYKSKEWCKGISKTTIQVPGGYAPNIEAITEYYFNYGAKEVWVVSNVNGQVNEVHVVNE